MTIRRALTPICGAARPAPFSARIVSCMSSMSVCSSGVSVRVSPPPAAVYPLLTVADPFTLTDATGRQREFLVVEENGFDAAISRVGLIYFPDKQKALTAMRRALRPGGRIVAIVYSTPQANPFFSIPVSIIRRRAEIPPPAPGQPGPFSLGTVEVLEGSLRQAGFRNVECRLIPAPLRAYAELLVAPDSVRTGPGQSAVTVTPAPLSSAWVASLRLSTKALVAA